MSKLTRMMMLVTMVAALPLGGCGDDKREPTEPTTPYDYGWWRETSVDRICDTNTVIGTGSENHVICPGDWEQSVAVCSMARSGNQYHIACEFSFSLEDCHQTVVIDGTLTVHDRHSASSVSQIRVTGDPAGCVDEGGDFEGCYIETLTETWLSEITDGDCTKVAARDRVGPVAVSREIMRHCAMDAVHTSYPDWY